MKIIQYNAILFSFLILSTGLFAQTAHEAYQSEDVEEISLNKEVWEKLRGDGEFESPNKQYKSESLSEHEFDKTEWEKAKEGKSFTKVEKEIKEQEQKPISPLTNGLSKTAKTILFGLALLVLVFFIIKIFVGNANLTNKKVSSTRPLVLEEVEQNLQESDLDRYLREALTNKNYRVAIRLYYLMIIKELSSRNLIKWKPDKTNLDYLSEMRSHGSFSDFRNVTRTFDKVWYGEMALEQQDFSKIGPLFEQYINQIKS